MNRKDIARAAFNLNDPNQYSYYADNFQWSDSLGSPPMDRNAWLGMAKTMRSAFPDLSFVIEDIRDKGEEVAVTGHFTGTFANGFDLSAVGAGKLPATGAEVDFPSSTTLLSFEGDKISKLRDTSTGPDAGMPGFIKLLTAPQKQ